MTRCQRSLLRRHAIALSVATGLAVAACGADVDLGGTATTPLGPDASSALSGECEPCTRDEDCGPKSACVELNKNLYCATKCASNAGCEPDELCRQARKSTGEVVSGCVPTDDICKVTPSAPAGADGGAVTQCGELVAPSVVASCKDCHFDCQPNGCYAGWWCNRATLHCAKPPKGC